MSTYPDSTTHVMRSARLSEDGLYRYELARRWALGPTARFVMLNPSTADGTEDDPTIRRCVGFARALGCGALVVVNLFAYRATRPADLWRAADPIGPRNNLTILEVAEQARHAGGHLIAAWGARVPESRVEEVLGLLDAAGARHLLAALGTTQTGAPRHPLYLPSSARPSPWPTIGAS
jgi:hypothetical protein